MLPNASIRSCALVSGAGQPLDTNDFETGGGETIMTNNSARMSPLMEYCAAAVAALKAQYDMTSVLGHAATAGAAREILIQKFLIDHLPEMTSVVSGIIVDAKGNRSKQQDIVLMLKSMPRLRFASGHDLIFQEGAVATFEIKTSIVQRSVIEDIGANIRSVRGLSATSLGGASLGNLDWPHARILTAVLTYNGSSLSTIAQWWESIPEGDRPDLYIDLSNGILVRNEGLIDPVDKGVGDYFIIEGAPLGLARFLTILTEKTAKIQFREVKWQDYIG